MSLFGSQVIFQLLTSYKSTLLNKYCFCSNCSRIFYSNHLFDVQILSYQRSGLKLGTFKSINESITRVAVYISLLALYALGGSKVKTVRYACL